MYEIVRGTCCLHGFADEDLWVKMFNFCVQVVLLMLKDIQILSSVFRSKVTMKSLTFPKFVNLPSILLPKIYPLFTSKLLKIG